jgi:RHS repeat-associated protein
VAVKTVNGWRWMQNDHLGTPQQLLNLEGAVVHRQRMEAYGRSVRNGEEQSLRFAGQVEDAHSGTYYNFHRNYEARSGSYTQWDPIGLRGGVNGYGYAAGRPTMATDPRGLFLCDDWKWMAFDWATGLGSRNRTYGEESDQVQQLKNLPVVNWARQRYQQKNAGNKGPCCDATKLQGVTDVGSKFGIPQFIQATMQGNCAWHFVGSFSLNVTPISCSQARFTVTNNSSFKSFSYGVGPAWNSGPMGNLYQTYTWEESL